MILRELEPKEEVVFDVIIQQKEQSCPGADYFVYDVYQGEEILMQNGSATKYGIGYQEQHEIIQKLTSDGFIKANWITGTDNGFIFKYGNGEAIQERHSLLFLDLIIEPNIDYKNFYFIELSFAQIKTINDTYRKKYLCVFAYDSTKYHFFITCDNGEKIVITKLKNDMRPFEVLRIATKKAGQLVTRSELNENPNEIVHVDQESISSQVFDKNSVVKKALTPFVQLKSNSLCVNSKAELTLAQLEKIKEDCIEIK